MKKINWKLFNLALWAEIILSYILPFQTADHFQYSIGFPVPFLSVYRTQISVNPLMSMHFNPLSFVINSLIIYWVMLCAKRLYSKYQHSLSK